MLHRVQKATTLEPVTDVPRETRWRAHGNGGINWTFGAEVFQGWRMPSRQPTAFHGKRASLYDLNRDLLQ